MLIPCTGGPTRPVLCSSVCMSVAQAVDLIVPDVDALYGWSYSSGAMLVRLHECGTGSGLSQAVALQYRAPHARPIDNINAWF